MTVPKPLVLTCATPTYGHVMPLRAIAKELIVRGYDVTFVTGSAFKERIEGIGARFIPLEGYADWSEATIDAIAPERRSLPPGLVQISYNIEHCFINCIPEQHAAQQRALKFLTEKHPGRPIVMCNEAFYLGTMPCLLGTEGIRPVASIAIGIIPVVLSSIDTPAFGPGLPLDSSPEGRARNIAMNKEIEEKSHAKPDRRFKEIMQQLGAKKTPPFFGDSVYLLPDRFLQMCIPSAEYPRSDAPPTMHFAGGLPKGVRDPFTNPPLWWSEITNNTTKKIIAVSQGSLALNYEDLVIPTLKCFQDRNDVLVVAALGKKGATLPEAVAISENARVADFIPFDDLLPHCAVFVTNGGYGAFQHALSNGTPVVVAGATEDKPEVAARAEWAGIGINLRTGSPSPEQVRAAVEEVFANDRYKARCRELEEEMKGYDPMEMVQRSIDDLAAGN